MSTFRVFSCGVARVFAMNSVFSWQNSISLWPASFCIPRPNLPVTPGISWLPTFAFQSPLLKGTSFWVLVLEGLVGLHRPIQLQLVLEPGTSTNKLDEGFQNDSCQDQCPMVEQGPPNGHHQCLFAHGKLHYLLPFQETHQNQQGSVTQTHFKFLLLPWVPEGVRFWIHPLRLECMSP